ncbi:MAG: DUF4166 domain-containing protein [Alphaproteobacteria bacterium]|nr:DUF4166 domain-containing protein [Alphaproteobacteria bacterium]
MADFRVVVIGGSGVFGARVCRLLARDRGIAMVIAARRVAPAEALAASLRRAQGRDDIVAAVLDVDAAGWTQALAELRPAAVIHAAGPFQGADYRVADTCIGMGAHDVDLADASGFVCGISTLDGAARAAGVLAASGASSVPALSAAVVELLSADLTRIDAIDIAISPGNRAPRGRATVAAILSYVGHRLRLWRGGAWRDGVGWQDLHRRDLSLPGGDSLGWRWFALCDVPDLTLFPDRYAVRQRVAFHAGLEVALLHLGLWLLSWPVRWGWIASWAPGAGALRAAADVVYRLGSDRGGMLVDVAGRDAGDRAVTRRWRLLAEAGDGPWIPALASVALVRKLARGAIAVRGAMPCVGLLSDAEILAEAEGLAIRWADDAVRPLYVHNLGAAYDTLPSPVAQLHDVAGGARWQGRADIEGASGPWAWMVAHLFGFPTAAADVAATVEFEVRDGVETWRRRFGAHRFASRQYAGHGAARGLIVERFGAVAFAMQAEATPAGIALRLRRGWLFGVPLPRWLWPRIAATERVDEVGRFRFDVAIALPGIGRLVRYRGWLEPAPTP